MNDRGVVLTGASEELVGRYRGWLVAERSLAPGDSLKRISPMTEHDQRHAGGREQPTVHRTAKTHPSRPSTASPTPILQVEVASEF
jgi:hypothetical protein